MQAEVTKFQQKRGSDHTALEQHHLDQFENIKIITSIQLKIVFLCETRRRSAKLNYLRWKLGLRNYVGVDSDCLSGGLALFWHESLQVCLRKCREIYRCKSPGAC